jgi:hypothetical protein
VKHMNIFFDEKCGFFLRNRLWSFPINYVRRGSCLLDEVIYRELYLVRINITSFQHVIWQKHFLSIVILVTNGTG